MDAKRQRRLEIVRAMMRRRLADKPKQRTNKPRNKSNRPATYKRNPLIDKAAEVERMTQEGRTTQEIAEGLGGTLEQVKYVRRKFGLAPGKLGNRRGKNN